MSKLVETKTNSKYLIGYIDKVILDHTLRRYFLKWVDMLRYLKLKMEIKVKTIIDVFPYRWWKAIRKI